MLSEYVTPANIDLGKEKFYFALSSLDTHLGGFTASFVLVVGGRMQGLALAFFGRYLNGVIS